MSESEDFSASDIQTVSKDEAEKLIRAIERKCKGPIKVGKEAEYAELRRAAGAFGDAGSGNSIELLDALNRDYCGADFNDVVVQYPYDGKEHTVNCPNCKKEITFASPIFKVK